MEIGTYCWTIYIYISKLVYVNIYIEGNIILAKMVKMRVSLTYLTDSRYDESQKDEKYYYLYYLLLHK